MHDLAQFFTNGYFRFVQPNGPEVVDRVMAAANRLRAAYPNGFDHSEGFGSTKMLPRTTPPLPNDRAPTLIYHNAGFIEPDLFLPLQNPAVYETIERVVGRDFYLSNVWLQVVPPGTGRMGYHKDEHGSVSITMPLDDIGWRSGSTCLVPGTHRNTPPPVFCMSNIMLDHKREAQLTGAAGDVIFFTPEAWHGRAENSTDTSTCRLFFNFYSRSSRDSTRWSPCIPAEQVAHAAEVIPFPYRHMFRIDPAPRSENLQQSKFMAWVTHNGSSSSSSALSALLREYFYWKGAIKAPIGTDARGTDLPSYRTTITESERFSVFYYIRHLDPVRTIKNTVRLSLEYWMSVCRLRAKPVEKGGE
ncbi:phytanoyl-CoA dioxygenase family protein [Glaciimonas sp. GNP009]